MKLLLSMSHADDVTYESFSVKIEIPSFYLSITFFHKKLYIFWMSTKKYILSKSIKFPELLQSQEISSGLKNKYQAFFPLVQYLKKNSSECC